MTDREKARDLGNQSAALARSIADVLNDMLDALEAAEKERDRWRVVACNVKDTSAAAEARVTVLEAALADVSDWDVYVGCGDDMRKRARAALAKEDTDE